MQDWIATTLCNDEASSDEEMRQHFITEGQMSPDEARFYVWQRNAALRDPLNFTLKRYVPSFTNDEFKARIRALCGVGPKVEQPCVNTPSDQGYTRNRPAMNADPTKPTT